MFINKKFMICFTLIVTGIFFSLNRNIQALSSDNYGYIKEISVYDSINKNYSNGYSFNYLENKSYSTFKNNTLSVIFHTKIKSEQYVVVENNYLSIEDNKFVLQDTNVEENLYIYEIKIKIIRSSTFTLVVQNNSFEGKNVIDSVVLKTEDTVKSVQIYAQNENFIMNETQIFKVLYDQDKANFLFLEDFTWIIKIKNSILKMNSITKELTSDYLHMKLLPDNNLSIEILSPYEDFKHDVLFIFFSCTVNDKKMTSNEINLAVLDDFSYSKELILENEKMTLLKGSDDFSFNVFIENKTVPRITLSDDNNWIEFIDIKEIKSDKTGFLKFKVFAKIKNNPLISDGYKVIVLNKSSENNHFICQTFIIDFVQKIEKVEIKILEENKKNATFTYLVWVNDNKYLNTNTIKWYINDDLVSQENSFTMTNTYKYGGIFNVKASIEGMDSNILQTKIGYAANEMLFWYLSFVVCILLTVIYFIFKRRKKSPNTNIYLLNKIEGYKNKITNFKRILSKEPFNIMKFRKEIVLLSIDINNLCLELEDIILTSNVTSYKLTKKEFEEVKNMLKIIVTQKNKEIIFTHLESCDVYLTNSSDFILDLNRLIQ